MSDADLICNLEENKGELEEHEEKFVESVAEQYYKNKRISDEQRKWLKIYYDKINKLLGTDDYGQSDF